MKSLLAATGNLHKLCEIREILAPHEINVQGADDVGNMPEVIEDGATFEANAVKKATEVAVACNRPTMADDSGLEVFALDGEPGVYSARYAGPGCSDQDNVKKLLERMRPISSRKGRFRCVIALATPAGLIGTAEGEVRGVITHEPRGSGGFGYDPVFIPEGDDCTFAELAPELKNSLSHRTAALHNALNQGLFQKYQRSREA